MPAAWHWGMGSSDHAAPRLQMRVRDLNLRAIYTVVKATVDAEPQRVEEAGFAMLLWDLQVEFPGSLTSLLHRMAELHGALPRSQAAHRSALANVLYVQGIMGNCTLPVLLVSLGRTAAMQPGKAERLGQAVGLDCQLGAAVLRWDCLRAGSALKGLNVEAGGERPVEMKRCDAMANLASEVSS